MNITVEKTESDFSRKFQVPVGISQSERVYSEAGEALNSPIAHKIFGFPWTESVTVGPDYVIVQRQDWVQWDVLEEPLKGLIAEHFSAYEGKSIEENPQAPEKKEETLNSPEAQEVQKLFEEEINPSLAGHGGFVTLKAVEKDTVYLEMGGGCQGCAMSYMTLKEGIETAIKTESQASKALWM